MGSEWEVEVFIKVYEDVSQYAWRFYASADDLMTALRQMQDAVAEHHAGAVRLVWRPMDEG